MKSVQRILVYIDNADHAGFLVEKALRLKHYADALLYFVQPIDDVLEDAQMPCSDEEREQIIRQLEGIKFVHCVEPHAVDENWVEWPERSCKDIISTAHRLACDLIVKDAFVEKRLDNIVHSAHDWGLLRHADVSVMMIKSKPWVEGSNIVAAIDVFDSYKHALNVHVLRYAGSLAELLGGQLHVVNAVPPLRGAVLEHATVAAYERLVHEVEAQRHDVIQRLLSESEACCAQIHVVEGVPGDAVNELVNTLEAECLVIGKVRRSVQNFLGTTAEQLLHVVNSDVVFVV